MVFKGVCEPSKEVVPLVGIWAVRLELSLAVRMFSIYQLVGI